MPMPLVANSIDVWSFEPLSNDLHSLALALSMGMLLFSTSACAIVDYQMGQRDDDADGVINAVDRCPGTEADTIVRMDGCSLFSRTLEGVEFELNAVQLTEAARRSLDELVAGLQAHPEVVIAVNGHTDNRGKASRNLELSKRRVMRVVEYLVEAGVSHTRLKPYGYGESRPLASNSTAKGRKRNRRIDVELLNRQIPEDSRQMSYSQTWARNPRQPLTETR